MRNVAGKDLVRALLKAGFREHHVRGSHFYLLAPDGHTIISVPVHGTRALKPKTLSSILKLAGIDKADLKDLL